MRHFIIANNPVLTVKDIEKFFITKGDRVYIFASSDKRIINTLNLFENTEADIILCLLGYGGIIQQRKKTEISDQLWELAKEIKIFNFFDKDLDFDTLFKNSLETIKKRDYSNKLGKYKNFALEKYKSKIKVINYSSEYNKKTFKFSNKEEKTYPSTGFQLITYLVNKISLKKKIYIIGFTFEGSIEHYWDYERKIIFSKYKFKKIYTTGLSYYIK